MKIASSLFSIVRDRAGELNLHTYELRSGSKAETVFLGEVDIPAEDTLWKELLAPKQLLPFTQNGNGDVFIVQHRPVEDEIRTLGAYIDWYLQTHPGVPAGEVLVLVNRRLIGNGIREVLNDLATQHNRAWKAESFYFEDALSAPAAAEGFALLTLLVNPEDRPALRYLLGEGRADCRRGPYARIRAHCEQTGESPREVLQLLAAGALQLRYTQPLVTRFTQIKQRLAAMAPLGVQQLVDALFPVGGGADVATVRQVASLIVPNVQTASELLGELRPDIVQPELPGTQGRSIWIMSLHKSKGLTARLVIIAGCVSTSFPQYARPHRRKFSGNWRSRDGCSMSA